MRVGALIAVAAMLAGGAQAQERDGFDPLAFFAGRTRSQGAFLDESGRPGGRFSNDIIGRREADGSTVFSQTIRFNDGSTRQQSLRIVRTGPSSIEVTGTSVVGVARGTIAGRSLRLVSTVRTEPGNPLSDVDLDQTYTASADGRRVRNVSTISKLGLLVTRADETFVKGGGPVARRTR